jgi:hypothetical protein
MMKRGDKVVFIGAGELRGRVGEFDQYTNKAKTRCRYFLALERGEVGFTGFVENLKLVKPDV